MSRDPTEGSDEEGAEPAGGEERPDSDSDTTIVDLDAASDSETEGPKTEDSSGEAGSEPDSDESGSGAPATDESAEAESDEAPQDDATETEDAADADEETEPEADEDAGEAAEADTEEAETEEDEDTGDDGDEEEAEGDESDAEDGDGEDDGETTTTAIDRKAGPSSDQEQPLADHIEEMVKRIAVVVVIAGAVSLLAFPYGEEFINFLWYSVLPSDISKPHVYHPLELVVTQLKAASLLGLVLALPVFVYETYAFMRPGLYPHERRYYLAAVPTSLVLAFVGLLFGYFLILPAVMTYFLQYSRDVVDIAFALGQTFSLMLVLLGFLAVVFQIPLFVMLAIMMGLTTRTWLEERRLIIWGVFLAIAFLFSPDPTGMAPFLVAVTMIGLFEGTLLLLRWTGRGG